MKNFFTQEPRRLSFPVGRPAPNLRPGDVVMGVLHEGSELTRVSVYRSDELSLRFTDDMWELIRAALVDLSHNDQCLPDEQFAANQAAAAIFRAQEHRAAVSRWRTVVGTA